jgi:hypothetical protein
VTTDAVMGGAWVLPEAKRAVLLFVNVGDEPVSARLDFDGREYQLPDRQLQVERITAEASEESFTTPPALERQLTFEPRTAWAWEVSAE